MFIVGPGPVGPPPPPPPCAAAARIRRKIVSGQFDEENPFVLISSVLLVQDDEGVSFLVVDRIGDIYRNLPRRADVIVTTVGARHKCQQGCEGEGQYRTLISLLGYVSPHAPSGILGFTAGRGFYPIGGAPGEMPPRRRGRDRGQFQDESGGQNKDQRSFPSRGRGRRVEDEVDDLTTHVESMEIVMARFQRMSPQIFNGDESSEERGLWLLFSIIGSRYLENISPDSQSLS
ncbi:2-methylene-furan-3-one reductase-like [Dorcoceras hygrometricum]|uniref:2-methylene-furan-3-one reductase-like n=1 Tax=Dorcoceras hygrometricum TaxID=472368 RepID=A0A2Z7C753_9LAMI|nr:2-methylene-furan-3-one reductase-like [Dorcoceras hygrometricum]